MADAAEVFVDRATGHLQVLTLDDRPSNCRRSGCGWSTRFGLRNFVCGIRTDTRKPFTKWHLCVMIPRVLSSCGFGIPKLTT